MGLKYNGGCLLERFGVTTLSELDIDVDKHWQGKGITNIAQVAAGMVTGDLLVSDGARIIRLSPGMVGEVLTAAGPGNIPIWLFTHWATAGMLPTVVTSDTEATLHAEVIHDLGQDCQGRFRYRELGAPGWTETAWQNGLRQGDPFSEDLVGLTPGTVHEVQCQARTDTDIGWWSASDYFMTFGAPTGAMELTTGITDTEATLNAEITKDENEDCEGRFRHRELTEHTVAVQIGHTDDDNMIYNYSTEGSGGTFYKQWYNMGNQTNTDKRSAMLRFTGITIPANAIITKAWVRFTAFDDRSNTKVNLRLWANKAAAPTAPTNVATFWGKVKTTASVDWDDIPAWTAGNEYDSPELKELIQELIDEYGAYVAGAMQIIIWNNGSDTGATRRPTDFEQVAGDAAVLHIEYLDPCAWVETAWANGLRLNDPFDEDLVGLTPDTGHEAQCQVRNAWGTGPWSAVESFKTLP